MDTKFIEQLFYKQIKDLTLKTAEQSYDYQFSDGWINNERSHMNEKEDFVWCI